MNAIKILIGAFSLAVLTISSALSQNSSTAQSDVERRSNIPTAVLTDATGTDVRTVVHTEGFFQKRGKDWVEMDLNRNVRFRFTERARDESSVTLRDQGRDMTLRINLNDQKIYWGQGVTATNPLYDITAVSAFGGAVDIPANSAEGIAAVGKQCVKANFGIGYVAKVRWYEPINVVYNEKTNGIAVRIGAEPYKEENIAVLQESCIHTDYPMFAQVSVVNGKLANEAIKLAIGSVFSVVSGGLSDSFGAAVCSPNYVDFCIKVATKAFSGAVALTSQGAQQSVRLLPDAQQTFYLGTPGKLEVSGTVWNASAEETRAYGTGRQVGDICDSDSQCYNNTCARESAREGNRSICCASGQEGKYAGHEYCYGLTRGTQCWSDAMCGSGLSCKGNAGGLKRGTCG